MWAEMQDELAEVVPVKDVMWIVMRYVHVREFYPSHFNNATIVEHRYAAPGECSYCHGVIVGVWYELTHRRRETRLICSDCWQDMVRPVFWRYAHMTLKVGDNEAKLHFVGTIHDPKKEAKRKTEPRLRLIGWDPEGVTTPASKK